MTPDRPVSIRARTSPSRRSLFSRRLVALLGALSGCGDGATDPVPDVEQPVGRRIVSIASTRGSTCVLSDAGAVFCWGENRAGEFGNGTEEPSAVPVPGAGGLRLAALYGSRGTSQMCGIEADGRAHCWGYNLNGELGGGTEGTRPTPIAVAGDHRFATIATAYHTCALDVAGRAYCWGATLGGQLGDGGSEVSGENVLRPQPVVGSGRYTAITNGMQFTCALREGGAADCWGWAAGLGSGDGDRSVSTPIPVDGGLRFARISAGSEWVCALTLDGSPYCWGKAGRTWPEDFRPTPEPVRTTLRFREIVAQSAYGACALTPAGEAYCWYGRGRPMAVPGGRRWAGLGTGAVPGVDLTDAGYCGYTAGGAGFCWRWADGTANGAPAPFLTEPAPIPPLS